MSRRGNIIGRLTSLFNGPGRGRSRYVSVVVRFCLIDAKIVDGNEIATGADGVVIDYGFRVFSAIHTNWSFFLWWFQPIRGYLPFVVDWWSLCRGHIVLYEIRQGG